jgi:deoxyxylulose-5-phosphate synthase
MKTFLIKVLSDSNNAMITSMLKKLASERVITFEEAVLSGGTGSPISEEQGREMIDQAELGPYYTTQEAKKILKI